MFFLLGKWMDMRPSEVGWKLFFRRRIKHIWDPSKAFAMVIMRADSHRPVIIRSRTRQFESSYICTSKVLLTDHNNGRQPRQSHQRKVRQGLIGRSCLVDSEKTAAAVAA